MLTTTIPALASQLLDDRTHHIEYGGYLTSDAEHLVVAMARLGASEGLAYLADTSVSAPAEREVDSLSDREVWATVLRSWWARHGRVRSVGSPRPE